MRPPSLPTLLRTFSIANFTTRLQHFPSISKSNTHLYRYTLTSSMPTIPFIGALFSTNSKDNNNENTMANYPVQKSSSEWQAILSPEQFRVIRGKGTEAPYVGKYDKHMPSEGVYTCAACSTPLYTANHKFKSGCGWPAYFDSIPGAVERHTDRTLGMDRTEITCAKCGGHLGHVFKGEGYPTPTDERHCVNSVSLNFSAEGEGAAKKE